MDTTDMVVPLLVLAGRADEADRQLDGHEQRLRDPATGLYAHKWDEGRRTLTGAALWGNGWVAAALARALRLRGRDGSSDDLALGRQARHAS